MKEFLSERLTGWLSSLGIGLSLVVFALLAQFLMTIVLIGSILSVLSIDESSWSFPALMVIIVLSLTLAILAFFLAGFRFGFRVSRNGWEDLAFSLLLYITFPFLIIVLLPYLVPKIISLNEFLFKGSPKTIIEYIEYIFQLIFPIILILSGAELGRKRKNGRTKVGEIIGKIGFPIFALLAAASFFVTGGFYWSNSTYREPPCQVRLASKTLSFPKGWKKDSRFAATRIFRGDGINHFESVLVWKERKDMSEMVDKHVAGLIKQGGKEIEKGSLKVNGKKASYHIVTFTSYGDDEDSFVRIPPMKNLILRIPGEGVFLYEAWEDDFDMNKIIKFIE